MIIEKVRERVNEFYQKAPASLRRLIGGHLLCDRSQSSRREDEENKEMSDGWRELNNSSLSLSHTTYINQQARATQLDNN